MFGGAAGSTFGGSQSQQQPPSQQQGQFGFASTQPQQQQQQQQQPQQAQAGGFGQTFGGFSAGNSLNQGGAAPSQPQANTQSGFSFGQPQQPQQAQSQPPAWNTGGFSQNTPNGQGYQSAPAGDQHQQFMLQQQQHQQQQQQQYQHQQQYQQQPQQQQHQQQSPWSQSQSTQPQPFQAAHQQQMTHQQSAVQQQTYLPGYLSKLRSQRPYSPSASRKASDAPGSPPPTDAVSAGALTASTSGAAGGNVAGTGAGFSTPNSRSSREGNRRTSLDGGPTSPMHGFSSSFFSSPTSDPYGQVHSQQRPFDGSGSIFGAGGLRGNAQSARRGAGGSGAGSGREASFTAGTPGRDRSTSYMRSSSFGIGSPQSSHDIAGPASGGSGGASGDNDEDDDDAPPAEALGEADASRNGFATSFGESIAAMATSPPPAQHLGRPSSSLGASVSGAQPTHNLQHHPQAQQQQQSPHGAHSHLCTLLVYGFPSTITPTVLAHFGAIGEIVSHSSLAPAGNQGDAGGPVFSECLRIVYAEPWHALRAVRRNGEVVAGAAYVGVRWADESLHQEAMLNGVQSPVFAASAGAAGIVATSSAGPLASASNAPGTSGAQPSSSSSSSSSSSALGSSVGPGARTARGSTPSFGRPINLVDSPAAALRARAAAGQAGGTGSGTSSPFGKAIGGLFGGGSTASSSGQVSAVGTPSRLGAGSNGAQSGTAPGTPGNQSGVMGRIGDAIFGW
ncbi:unnamed protein product [Parajaminaea phylloscopi]